MKRFQFSLNTVLSYKQQVLEELQNESMDSSFTRYGSRSWCSRRRRSATGA